LAGDLANRRPFHQGSCGNQWRRQTLLRIARMRHPSPPAGTVDFFRTYYGPTKLAFDSLSPSSQTALHRDLVEFQSRHDQASEPQTTEVAAEYLEIVATKY
jgi:hypothetical protein